MAVWPFPGYFLKERQRRCYHEWRRGCVPDHQHDSCNCDCISLTWPSVTAVVVVMTIGTGARSLNGEGTMVEQSVGVVGVGCCEACCYAHHPSPSHESMVGCEQKIRPSSGGPLKQRRSAQAAKNCHEFASSPSSVGGLLRWRAVPEAFSSPVCVDSRLLAYFAVTAVSARHE